MLWCVHWHLDCTQQVKTHPLFSSQQVKLLCQFNINTQWRIKIFTVSSGHVQTVWTWFLPLSLWDINYLSCLSRSLLITLKKTPSTLPTFPLRHFFTLFQTMNYSLYHFCNIFFLFCCYTSPWPLGSTHPVSSPTCLYYQMLETHQATHFTAHLYTFCTTLM